MIDRLHPKGRYSHGQEVMLEYLKAGLKDGKRFFKSRYIARDLGMTSKAVGLYMRKLSGSCDELRIERWSYSKSTTWHILGTTDPVACK